MYHYTYVLSYLASVILFLKKIIFKLYTLVFCLLLCLCEKAKYPETGISDKCELPHGCWN